jgi:hypothetical protein
MVAFGELEVKSPERSFEVPSVSHPADAEFSGQARLIGIDLPTDAIKPGDSLPVTLVWQGITDMEVSYSIFLHLVGPDGMLVTQSDGVPVGWSRPTTGWLPGEVVRETRRLSIPDDLAAGVYELRVGLYDPKTDERLTLVDEKTFVSWTLTLISP